MCDQNMNLHRIFIRGKKCYSLFFPLYRHDSKKKPKKNYGKPSKAKNLDSRYDHIDHLINYKKKEYNVGCVTSNLNNVQKV